jgi:phenylalanyl-tRNA synthetase beta subunit
MDKVFTNEEVNQVQEKLREVVVQELGVELR